MAGREEMGFAFTTNRKGAMQSQIDSVNSTTGAGGDPRRNSRAIPEREIAIALVLELAESGLHDFSLYCRAEKFHEKNIG